MHHHRLTAESMAANAKSQLLENPSVQFQVQNHDDLLRIVKAIRIKKILDEDKSAALAIGLKLFAGIVIEKRGDPLFAPLVEPIQNFIRELKTVQVGNIVEIRQGLVNALPSCTDASLVAGIRIAGSEGGV